MDDVDTVVPVMTPSMGGFLTPIASSTTVNKIQVVHSYTYSSKHVELLDRITGNGLGIVYRYMRHPYLLNQTMLGLSLVFTNYRREDITDIKVEGKVGKLEIDAFVIHI